MLKVTRIVFVKEARDLLRDKRALFFLFAVPLVMPLLGMLAGVFVLWQVVRQAGEGIPIVVVNGDQLPGLVARLEAASVLKLVGMPFDPEAALQSGKLMAVLEIPSDAAALLEVEQPVTLRLTSSRSGWLPDFAVLAIQSALDDYGNEVLMERLAQRDLDREWLEPIRLERGSAAPTGVAAVPIVASEETPSLLGSVFLPMVVASWALGGGLSLMAPMTVGEKEHRTMESLLVTPASRIGIVSGKIALSIVVSAITVGLWSVDSLGYVFLLSVMPAGFGGLATSFALQLGNLGLVTLWLVLLMLPFMTMANGFVAAVCTFAKDYRESGLFLTALQLLLPGLALLAVFGFEARPPVVVYALPAIGVFVALRDLFGGGIAPGALVLAWGAAAIYAVGAILLAAYAFSREWALMRGV